MRIRAIALRILRQFIHDKRTMALMFAAPLLVLCLMSLVFGGEYTPKIGVYGDAAALSAPLGERGAEVTVYASAGKAEKAVRDGKIDAAVSLENNGSTAVLLEGSNPTAARSVLSLLTETLPSDAAASGHTVPQPKVDYVYGSADMTTIDRFGPIMIGVFIFFFVFLIAGVSLLRERTTGTLERLLATPIRRWEIVVGYVAGFGLFTVVQALLISWFSIDILGIQMAGSFGYVLLVTLLLALSALTLGTLLSAFAANELQMIQFIPLVIVPQIFLSGLFPLDTLPVWLQRIGLATPLYYGAQALMDIMIRGKGWSAIDIDIYALLAFSLAFMALNVLGLKKQRSM